MASTLLTSMVNFQHSSHIPLFSVWHCSNSFHLTSKISHSLSYSPPQCPLLLWLLCKFLLTSSTFTQWSDPKLSPQTSSLFSIHILPLGFIQFFDFKYHLHDDDSLSLQFIPGTLLNSRHIYLDYWLIYIFILMSNRYRKLILSPNLPIVKAFSVSVNSNLFLLNPQLKLWSYPSLLSLSVASHLAC